MNKILDIESQLIQTPVESILLLQLLKVAKEANYTTVHNHWGYKAYDTYTIDEAITKFDDYYTSNYVSVISDDLNKDRAEDDKYAGDDLPF